MSPEHSRLFRALAAWAWLAASAGVLAQSSEAPPLQATVLLSSSGTPRKVSVHDIRRDTISLSFEGVDRAGRIPVNTIKKIHFALGDRAMEGQSAAKEERYTDAVKILQPYVTRLTPYLSIADNNISEVTDPYVLAIQQLGLLDQLRSYYQLISEYGEEAQKRTASVWLAYLDVREGHLERAEQAFEGLQEFDMGSEGYLLRHLGLCRILLERQDVRKAVDHAAKVTAACGIDHVLHPEALFLSAQCYDGLAAEEWVRLKEERQAKVKRALLIERVKVAREMEAKADAEGLPEPTEKQILLGVDEEKVDQQVPPLPALEDLKLSQTAQRLYLFLERVFPNTPWGKQAMAKVLPATREGDEQLLTMAARPPGPTASQTGTPQEKDAQAGGTPPSHTSGPGKASRGRSVEEFLAGQKKAMGKRWNRKNEVEFSAVFKTMDANKDGLLTREEEQAFYAEKK